jgi:alpha-beta hydrolase superfamily lysophospholipase
LPEPRGHVLLVHGAGGGGWEWLIWQRVLHAAGWASSAIDLQPGAAGLAATALADYQRQVDAALAALPRPRVVSGASLGGLLALRAASAADALVLVNPLPSAPWQHSDAGVLSEIPAIKPWSTQARFDGTLRQLPDDPLAARWAHSRWRDESGAVLREALAGVAALRPSVPTRVLISEGDRDIAPDVMLAFANAIGADVQRLHGLTHLQPLLGRAAGALAQQAVDWMNVQVAAPWR